MSRKPEERNRPQNGSRQQAACPSDVFQCRDGLVALTADSDEEFQCLCQAMGKPELAENERFAPLTNRIKFKNAASLNRIIREWVKEKTVAQVDRLGARYGFAASPVPDAKGPLFEFAQFHPRADEGVMSYR